MLNFHKALTTKYANSAFLIYKYLGYAKKKEECHISMFCNVAVCIIEIVNEFQLNIVEAAPDASACQEKKTCLWSCNQVTLTLSDSNVLLNSEFDYTTNINAPVV